MLISATEGLPVKVVGDFEDGVLVAQRVKVYAPDAQVGLEVRGALAQVQGSSASGRVRIGALWIELDRDTSWDLDRAREAHPDLVHAEIVTLLTEASDPASDRLAGRWSEAELFDLARDPGEQSPAEQGSRFEALWLELDSWGLLLVSAGLRAPVAQRALDEELLEQLSALGYAR